jgi:glycosyltransferase involved in cell wall biosynthesis
MKKLLILAYDFPPYVSVGGLRPYNWYRYLKEFGVEPIVVTRQWSNAHGNHLDYIAAGESNKTVAEQTAFGTILKTPYTPNFANRLLLKHGEKKYALARKSISAYYEFAQFLKPVGPKAELYRAARDFLQNNKVDAIIATGDPFVLFSYASKLSEEFGIPWIADYRDTWVQDKTRSRNIITKSWNTFFEKRFIKSASKITTVSNFIRKQLENNLKNKEFELILNGFNPEAIGKSVGINQEKDIFTIDFAGSIYNWHPIELFLEVCSEFLSTEKRFQLNFYGLNNPEKLTDLIDKKFSDLKKHITIYSKIENEQLVQILAKSNVFLLFNDYSILGTKIFTYLGIKRKILFCFSDDLEALNLKKKHFNLTEIESESKNLQADLINETNSGILVKDAAHLSEVLQELYTEFQTTGKIACESVGVEKYSRKIQVEKLAELVQQICGNGK